MENMTLKQKKECRTIIHSLSGLSGLVGAGLAQLPCSDIIAITPMQIAMTISLGKVFGIELTRSAAAAALASGLSSMLGRTASKVLLSWFGWFPGMGNLINAGTAISFTEAIGWKLAQEFAQQAADSASDMGDPL